MTVGELLIQERIKKGLSLRGAVEELNSVQGLKISAAYLSQLENDKSSFRRSETLQKIILFYNITDDDFSEALSETKWANAISKLSINAKKERLEAARIVLNKFSTEEVQNILKKGRINSDERK
jgi:transcriptional regulator with XRE-family HTH domain